MTIYFNYPCSTLYSCTSDVYGDACLEPPGHIRLAGLNAIVADNGPYGACPRCLLYLPKYLDIIEGPLNIFAPGDSVLGKSILRMIQAMVKDRIVILR